jgi:hypothetical protein
MTHRTSLAAIVGVGALLAATPANAGLVPPPGSWPPPSSVSPNPWAGGPFVSNGANASVSVRWRVGFGPRRRPAVTHTVGRSVVLRGTLTNALTDAPIVGAQLTVIGQLAGYDAWSPITGVATSGGGRFRVALPPDGHRRLSVLYWPASDITTPLFSRRVLARVRMSVRAGRPRRGRRGVVRFQGRVNGGLTPSAGLLVFLQVHNSHGNWVTIRIGRTLPSGRFVIRRRMPRGSFLVRLVVPSQPGSRLFAGRSRTWRVSR